MNRFEKIEGTIQAYQWGGYDFIPQLLSHNTGKSNEPSAEYWLGSHPSSPSTIKSSGEDIGHFLKARASAPLNFLFKVLDVKEMLSIQSHPTKEQAKLGFEEENKRGLDLNAKNRNYKDSSDKPELMVALSSFWLLHGIKTIPEIEEALSQKPYLSPLLNVLKTEGLDAAFRYALATNNESVELMHEQLISDCFNHSTEFSKNSIYFWINNWVTKNPKTTNGILTLFFLNLVQLNEGQAIYQPAGLLHAYLEGKNIELMANSDNVLRAGLTPKNIDVDELLRTCQLSSTQPAEFIIKTTDSDSLTKYPTPFKEFQLEAILAKNHEITRWKTQHPEILFCYEGSAELTIDEGESIVFAKGESILILPHASISISAKAARVFKARNC